MKISPEHLSKSSALSIAHIHRTAIKSGFLSTLPISFLCNLYQAISETAGAAVIVARDESNEIAGFTAAAINTGGMYKKIILRKGVLFVLQLLPVAFRWSTLRRIIETLFYFVTHRHSIKAGGTVTYKPPSAELLSIAVDGTRTGQGIGRSLVHSLDEWFHQQCITSYKVVTWSEDPVSNAFYVSCGFKMMQQFTHHGTILNEYVKKQ